MNNAPETQEAVERWNQGKINIFDEMARLERERDEAREKYDTLAVENMLEVNKLCNERDEARYVALRYRSLYFAQNGIDVNEYQMPWEDAK
jgi:hypothetical protein